MSVFTSPAATALLGALVGAGATFIVIERHAKNKDRRDRVSLAKALEAELSSLWAVYMSAFGNEFVKLGPAKFPEKGILKLHNEYFAVFDGSTHMLGLFSSETAGKVVETYLEVKSFLDENMYFGSLIREWNDLQKMPVSAEKSEKHLTLYPNINEHKKHMKKRHDEVKKLIEEAVLLLGKEV